LGVDDRATPSITEAAKLLHGKQKGESTQLILAGWQRMRDLDVFRQFVRAVPVR
jgi:hypothetical protein